MCEKVVVLWGKRLCQALWDIMRGVKTQAAAQTIWFNLYQNELRGIQRFSSHIWRLHLLLGLWSGIYARH